MSNEEHETITDIVFEMRKDIAEGTVGIWSDFGGEIARSYADRIEAAHQREVAELRKYLMEAVKEVCNRLEKCGFKEQCVFKTCYVQKWRKALQDKGGAK